MKKIIKLIFLLSILSGCVVSNSFAIPVAASASNTQLEPLPVRAGIKDNELIISVNVVSQNKKGDRGRSVFEIREVTRFSNPSTYNYPNPNGFILAARIRW